MIVGDTVADDPGDATEVRALLAPYEGHELTLREIYEAANKITTHYREKDYLVAKAYVPTQDATHGVLRLKLLLGRYGRFKINNASSVRDDFLRGIVDNALGTTRDKSPVIRKNELERAMLLIGDLKGTDVPRASVGPGPQQGLSDFTFDVPAERRLDGYLLGDKAGSPWTGRLRASAGVNLNSPLGYGDQLSLYGMVSDQARLANGAITYSFPLGYGGLHAQIQAFHTTYVLGGSFAALEADGVANGVDATLIYPILRSRPDSINISASFNHKSLNDRAFDISFANRSLDLGTLAVNRDTVGMLPLTQLPLRTSGTFSFTAGSVEFGDPQQRAENRTGAATLGGYQRLNLTFISSLELTDRISLTLNLTGQKSVSGNLDTSEQLQLTGSFGVRSFDEGLSGDTGFIATPEVRYSLPAIPGLAGLHHSLGFFTDVGDVWLENASYTTTQRSSTELNDVGIGYYANYEYSSGRSVLLRAVGVRTYGSNNGARLYDRGTKGLVQIGITL